MEITCVTPGGRHVTGGGTPPWVRSFRGTCWVRCSAQESPCKMEAVELSLGERVLRGVCVGALIHFGCQQASDVGSWFGGGLVASVAILVWTAATGLDAGRTTQRVCRGISAAAIILVPSNAIVDAGVHEAERYNSNLPGIPAMSLAPGLWFAYLALTLGPVVWSAARAWLWIRNR